jgi:hypothetical protein
MKRYWHFLIVGVICLLVALLWAQPPRRPASVSPAGVIAVAAAPLQQGASDASPVPKERTSTKDSAPGPESTNDGHPLPGSSSSLPLLAVIGFGVLAGGITSAMRTR